jgi:hypothetical protein
MIPKNEQGVVVLFAQQCQQAGYEILEISETYPDAIIRKDDIEYKIEFEYNANNFVAHNHDIRRCDLIVCWENDYHNCVLPVLELRNNQWLTQVISKIPLDKKRIAYWKTRALKAEREIKSLKSDRPPPIKQPETTRTQAAAILADHSGISGAELGRRLGKSERLGRKLKAEIIGNQNGSNQ